MIAYKFLSGDGVGRFSGFRWPLPDGGPGAWVDAPADPCRSGIHACRRGDLPLWLGRELYEIELEEPVFARPDKVVAGRGRLLRRIEAWDAAARDEYAGMCAARAHELTRSAGLPEWDAVVEPSLPEGPALLGFIAARIAERASGVVAYHAERARQSAWLVARLGL